MLGIPGTDLNQFRHMMNSPQVDGPLPKMPNGKIPMQ